MQIKNYCESFYDSADVIFLPLTQLPFRSSAKKYSHMMLTCGDFRNQILLLAILVEQGYISALPDNEREQMLRLTLCGFKRLNLAPLYHELAHQPNSEACQKFVMHTNKLCAKQQSVFTISFEKMLICDVTVVRKTEIHFNGGPRSIGFFIHSADVKSDEPDELLYIHIPEKSIHGIKLNDEIYPRHEYFILIYVKDRIECLNEKIGCMVTDACSIKIQLNSEKDFKYAQKFIGPCFYEPRPDEEPVEISPVTAWVKDAARFTQSSQPVSIDMDELNAEQPPPVEAATITLSKTLNGDHENVAKEQISEQVKPKSSLDPLIQPIVTNAPEEEPKGAITQLAEQLVDRIYASGLPSQFRSDSDLEDSYTDLEELIQIAKMNPTELVVEKKKTVDPSVFDQVKSDNSLVIDLDDSYDQKVEIKETTALPNEDTSAIKPSIVESSSTKPEQSCSTLVQAKDHSMHNKPEAIKSLERQVSALQQKLDHNRRGKKRTQSSWLEAESSTDSHDGYEPPKKPRRKLRQHGKDKPIAIEAIKLPHIEDSSNQLEVVAMTPAAEQPAPKQAASAQTEEQFKLPDLPKPTKSIVDQIENEQEKFTAITSTPQSSAVPTPYIDAIESDSYQSFVQKLSQSADASKRTETPIKPKISDAVANARATIIASQVKTEPTAVKIQRPTTCYGVAKRAIRGRKPKLAPGSNAHRPPLPPGASQDEYFKRAFGAYELPPSNSTTAPKAPKKFFKS